MKKAVLHLFSSISTLPHAIVIDAMPLTLNDSPYKDIAIESFIKGRIKICIDSSSINCGKGHARQNNETTPY